MNTNHHYPSYANFLIFVEVRHWDEAQYIKSLKISVTTNQLG